MGADLLFKPRWRDVFAFLVTSVGPSLGVVEPWAFGQVAEQMVHHTWWVVLLSGVLAGWMMGLLSWLVTASRDTISQVILVWIVTTAIGLSHLHHSIVGTVEVLAGIFAGQGITLFDFLHFIVWATLGNAIGGLVFVALIKYGHVTSWGKDAVQVDQDGQPAQTGNVTLSCNIVGNDEGDVQHQEETSSFIEK